MTSPAEAALALLAAAVILTLPGAAILRLLRVRGFAFFALTPALSVSIVSVSAIVGPWLGMSWGWWVPAAGLAVVLVVLGILRRLLPAVAGEPAPQTLARTSGGLERTAEEYRELLASAGFELTRIIPTKSPFSIIEAVKS